MRGPQFRETWRYVKAVIELHQNEHVIFGKSEVASVLRSWADLYERAGALEAALTLRHSAVWFETAEADPTPEQPGRITFREFEKQINEILADRAVKEASS